MVTKKFSWKFPATRFRLLKIESFFMVILAVLVFLTAFFQFGQDWLLAILFTLIFVLVYALISYAIQNWHSAEKHYHLTKTHLHIIKKNRNKEKKEKIALKNIVRHKLDRFFLGGYLVVKNKKHALFFNTQKEMDRFEKYLHKFRKK